jgi:hypothetical protein
MEEFLFDLLTVIPNTMCSFEIIIAIQNVRCNQKSIVGVKVFRIFILTLPNQLFFGA